MTIEKERIRCSVNNCHYWMNGNYCEASSVMITSDDIPSQTYHGIDNSAITSVNTPVQKCQETCCKTFIREEDKDEHKVDDVYKVGNQFQSQAGPSQYGQSGRSGQSNQQKSNWAQGSQTRM